MWIDFFEFFKIIYKKYFKINVGRVINFQFFHLEGHKSKLPFNKKSIKNYVYGVMF